MPLVFCAKVTDDNTFVMVTRKNAAVAPHTYSWTEMSFNLRLPTWLCFYSGEEIWLSDYTCIVIRHVVCLLSLCSGQVLPLPHTYVCMFVGYVGFNLLKLVGTGKINIVYKTTSCWSCIQHHCPFKIGIALLRPLHPLFQSDRFKQITVTLQTPSIIREWLIKITHPGYV